MADACACGCRVDACLLKAKTVGICCIQLEHCGAHWRCICISHGTHSTCGTQASFTQWNCVMCCWPLQMLNFQSMCIMADLGDETTVAGSNEKVLCVLRAHTDGSFDMTPGFTLPAQRYRFEDDHGGSLDTAGPTLQYLRYCGTCLACGHLAVQPMLAVQLSWCLCDALQAAFTSTHWSLPHRRQHPALRSTPQSWPA
jgi:hypothetical protein